MYCFILCVLFSHGDGGDAMCYARNPRLDDVKQLTSSILSKLDEWQKERQAYDDLPEV